MFTPAYINGVHLLKGNTFLNSNFNLFIIMDAVNGCCTELFNVIKFKINYSCFLRDLEKTKYVLNVCQFRWEKSNYFVINHS